MNVPFTFSSSKLPLLKAKQLQKAFPFFKLAVAQEATAQALGYASWFECTHRGTVGSPSPTDQEAGLPARIKRYYHQANVLMRLGVTPADADRWVRAWGLTGSPTLAPRYAVPEYYRWSDALKRLELGQIGESEARELWAAAESSKYPDIDRPVRICEGVLLGPAGKYPHYAVDPALQSRIPVYLRGPNSLYHVEDHSDVLGSSLAGFPKEQYRRPLADRLNRVQHEWHYGTKHPETSAPALAALEAAALAQPDTLMVISSRAMPIDHDRFDFDRRAVACLRGRDFATFIRSKGALDGSKVLWYRDVEDPLGSRRFGDFYSWLLGSDYPKDMERVLPVFEDSFRYEPCLPIYSYPFMEAPMASDEYGEACEQICLLPLAEDYERDDGDGDGEDQPDAPEPPNFARPILDLQPA